MKHVHVVTICCNVCLALMLYCTYAHNILLLPTLRRVLNIWDIEFRIIQETIMKIDVIESVHILTTASEYTIYTHTVHFSLEFIEGRHFSNKISTQNTTQSFYT